MKTEKPKTSKQPATLRCPWCGSKMESGDDGAQEKKSGAGSYWNCSTLTGGCGAITPYAKTPAAARRKFLRVMTDAAKAKAEGGAK